MKKSYIFTKNLRNLGESFLNFSKCRSLSLQKRDFTSIKNEHTPPGKSTIFKSDVADICLPNIDICSAYFPNFAKWSDRDALEDYTTGEKMTFGELIDSSMRWCAKLDEIDNTPEDTKRVSILAQNCIEYVPFMYGTFAAGRTVHTINTNYKVGEIERQLRVVQPKVAVVDAAYEELLEAAIKAAQLDIKVVTIGISKRGNPNLKEIIYDPTAPLGKIHEVNPSDISTIISSGGTTGLPKGVCISHAAITNNLLCFLHKDFYPLGHTPDTLHTSVMGLMPFYHTYGYFVVTMTNLFQGSKIIVCNNFDPSSFGSLIRKHKIRVLNLVPTLLNFIVKSPIITTEDLSSVRNVLISAAAVHTNEANAFVKKCDRDVTFQEGFGMTETLAATLSPLTSSRIGTCGKLVPNQMAKIVDPDSKKELGIDEEGELCVKGSGIMTEYLNNPEATSETFDEDGWLHTGDLATVSSDGYFKIVDRLKDLIKCKGFQVSPAEVENTILEHKSISEVAVVGVPDDRLGEKVRAYVSVKDKVTEEELINFVNQRLANYKGLSGGVVFLDSLPKLPTGKILRRELKEMAKSK